MFTILADDLDRNRRADYIATADTFGGSYDIVKRLPATASAIGVGRVGRAYVLIERTGTRPHRGGQVRVRITPLSDTGDRAGTLAADPRLITPFGGVCPAAVFA